MLHVDLHTWIKNYIEIGLSIFILLQTEYFNSFVMLYQIFVLMLTLICVNGISFSFFCKSKPQNDDKSNKEREGTHFSTIFFAQQN